MIKNEGNPDLHKHTSDDGSDKHLSKWLDGNNNTYGKYRGFNFSHAHKNFKHQNQMKI